MVNWIICAGTIFVSKTELFEMELLLTLKLYLRKTELFEIELFDLTELLEIKNFWQLNYVLIQNWIVWNRTVYLHKNGFGIK